MLWMHRTVVSAGRKNIRLFRISFSLHNSGGLFVDKRMAAQSPLARVRVLLPTLMKKWILVLLAAGLLQPAAGQTVTQPRALPPFLHVQDRWVDSVLNSLTLEEKIGQLFMIACWSRQPDSERVRISELITGHHIGGLIFMQGGPVRQAQLTNHFQSISKVPLLLSMDAEWGLSMRLDSVVNYSKQLMLGAMRDTSLVYEFGKEMARQLKRLGVHISFSPVVDVNNNPLNPVIGDRAFGENKFDVAKYGLAYMRGLQQNGLIACAKHFPGHGNTADDSHKVLPVINASRSELDSTELFPFRQLIHHGVGSVMVAHLNIPSLDPTQKLPSTLSPAIVTGLLRNELGFQGLVITDALNMKGVADYLQPGTVDVSALLAGNDLLLFSKDVPLAVQMIKDALAAEKISEAEINIRVRKILQAKYWCGLHQWSPVETAHLYRDLNNAEANFLKERLIENSLVLARNKERRIPLKNTAGYRFAAVAIGDTLENEFHQMLNHYDRITFFSIAKNAGEKEFAALLDSLQQFNAVFVSLHSMSRSATVSYGVTLRSREFLARLNKQATVFLTVFGSPYSLQYFDAFDYVLESFNEDAVTQEKAAQLWFGGMAAQGQLPVTASAEFYRGRGYITTPARLKYGLPEEAGLSTASFIQMEEIIEEAIRLKATPGCQVWVAKDGKVIWNKSYGHFTYDTIHPVQNSDRYDVASITKIAATTLMVMKLYEQNKLDLNKTIGDYLPGFTDSAKSKIKIYELLTHQAGLKPYIPFYREYIDSAGVVNPMVFCDLSYEPFTVEVAPGFYMNRYYVDTLWKRIHASPLNPRGKYVYSDLDFYFLEKIAENVAGRPLDEFVKENFYDPLRLPTTTYRPLHEVTDETIVPSNFDFNWRKRVLRGSVHDQGAAMLGGLAGHAGLFSNANDLGILMQMLLNEGNYAGVKFFDSSTVKKFTAQFSSVSRRGLGFDKPEGQADKPSPTCRSASPETFGHQGFTGTCVWVDPVYHLVYVFLSNRTFPDDSNDRLNSLGVRSRIHQAIYDAILSAGEH
jgi:beta-glucosidase-like glycosyl hydrolase/CubicO group peptidase (beta-lactamase class C family)